MKPAVLVTAAALAGCTQHAAEMRDPNTPKGYAVGYTTLEGLDPCGPTAITAIPADGVKGSGPLSGPYHEIKARSDARGNLTLTPKLMKTGRYRVIRARCRGPASFTGNAIEYRYSGRSLPTFTVREGEVTAIGTIAVKLLPATTTRGGGFGGHTVRPLPAAAVAAARRTVR